MSEGTIEVRWEYWPLVKGLSSPIVNEQGDPVEKRCTAVSLRHAIKLGNDLKKQHGKQLRFVDVVMRIIE